MKTARFIGKGCAIAALAASCGLAQATEIMVSNSGQFSVALATAASGDTITLLPSGSPYTQIPMFSFTGKRLTIRGSTGNPADVVLDGANLDEVLTISGAGADGSVIEALTIQHGRGVATAEAPGAGLVISDANVTIQNCIIHGNVVPGSDGNGAGLHASGGSVITVLNTLFNENSITGANGDGGAVFMNSGSAVFVDCQFNANIAEAVLGTDDASYGGAAYVENGAFRFTRCSFVGNRAELGGAVLVIGTATVTMDACLFQNNNARWGGGLFVGGGAAVPNVVRNTLFLGNTTILDGCALRADKSTNLINCTIVGNTASANYIIASAAADRRVVTVDNTIIWGNVAGTGIAQISATNAPIIRRGLLQSAYTVANGSAYNTVADPLFRGTGDYRLQAASPGIDAGDTTLYSGPLADYEGNSRGVDVLTVPDTGYAYIGPVVDIGAYEFAACYANCDESTAAPVLNANDFICFINRYAAGCP